MLVAVPVCALVLGVIVGFNTRWMLSRRHLLTLKSLWRITVGSNKNTLWFRRAILFSIITIGMSFMSVDSGADNVNCATLMGGLDDKFYGLINERSEDSNKTLSEALSLLKNAKASCNKNPEWMAR